MNYSIISLNFMGSKRLEKLDILRGLLVFLMIIFHTNFILNEIFFINTNIPFIVLKIIQIIGASLFILVAGISFALSEEKNKKSFYIKRFFIFLFIAFLISLITYMFFRQQFIIFGIVHFFAFAFLFLLIFRKLKYYNFLFGILFILIGIFIGNVIFPFKSFFWLGFTFFGFYSADYYPIFPWFGVILIGYSTGLYLIKKDLIQKVFGGNIKYTCLFQFFGKNSFIIYLIHVPIIYIILYLLFI